MWAIPGPIDCELREYNIDLGDRFGDRTVYVKVPVYKEDKMSPEYIRSHIICCMRENSYVGQYELETSFKLSSSEPTFKMHGNVQMIDPALDERRINDFNEQLTDTLINKVQSYYEVRDIKEENNMPVRFERLSDETLKALGTFPNDDAAKSQTKPKWTKGLPPVKKVEVYNNCVVKVTFIDDTFTKSVCSENDIFDLDVGITICAMKRLLGTNSDNATKQYNKFIKHVHQVMEENALEEVAEKARKASEKAKRRKIELKRAAKKLKAKEEQIDIQKQAYLRATMEITEDDLK